MIDIKVPAIGESISEVTLIKWLKHDGDYVDRDEVIAELESEKATFEVNAEKAGVLKTLGKEGDTLKIGEVLANIDESAAKPASKPEEKKSTARNFTYVSDLLTQINTCTPEQAFVLRTHLGNYTLFLSGMFAERVQSHAQRRGAPGLSFYEAVGQSSYLSVAQHPQAKRTELQAIFELLGTEFHRVRLALNHLTDTLLHMHAPSPIVLPPT